MEVKFQIVKKFQWLPSLSQFPLRMPIDNHYVSSTNPHDQGQPIEREVTANVSPVPVHYHSELEVQCNKAKTFQSRSPIHSANLGKG